MAHLVSMLWWLWHAMDAFNFYDLCYVMFYMKLMIWYARDAFNFDIYDGDPNDIIYDGCVYDDAINVLWFYYVLWMMPIRCMQWILFMVCDVCDFFLYFPNVNKECNEWMNVYMK